MDRETGQPVVQSLDRTLRYAYFKPKDSLRR